MHELDNPVWWAMAGAQRGLGTATPLAARFHPEITPFGGFCEKPAASHWRDLAGLIGPQEAVALVVETGSPPTGWTVLMEVDAVQMVGDRVSSGPGPSVTPAVSVSGAMGNADSPVPLGAGDADDMLALAAVARPGPFLSRTVECGGYFGIRRRHRLVAMAGERLRPPGYAEVSAVATHPHHRRQGLAESLVRAVVSSILDRGETPFLYAARDNVDAIRLYESIGFRFRKTVPILVVQPPGR